jgi:antitoxin component YwqK of YwqJK toxin-antitoxin module
MIQLSIAKRFLILAIIMLTFQIDAQRIKEFIPSDTAIYRGIRLHNKEQYQSAIESYKKVSPNDPNYPVALYYIALGFYDSKKYDSAVYYSSECVQFKEADIYESGVILRGLSYTELEDYPSALKNYDEALADYPKNVNFLHNKGKVYKKAKEFQKALDLFKQVNEEYSGFIQNQLAIAQLAEEEGYLTQAFLAYSHALIYSIGTKYHISILSDMNKLASKKLEENPKDLVFSAEGDQFAEIETLLKTQAALQKKYKISNEIDLPVVRQLHLLFAQLENYEPGNGYFDKYYVPYYKDIAKEGKFDKFIDIVFMIVNDPQIQKILNKRGKEILEFAEETSIKLATTVNRRDITIFDKKLNLACHFNKGIKSCGNYNENNKKEGVWYVFHENGNLNRYGELTDGKANNLWEYYYENGKKSSEYLFKDDKKNGIYKKYYTNGKTKEIGNYAEDSLEGEFSSFYNNGNLRSKGNFVNNKNDGEWKIYYVNNNLRRVSNYKEDLYDGEFTGYAIDGKTILTKLNYKNGKLDGRQESFYINGNKREEGEYSLNEKIGEHKEYFTDGTLKEETKYEDKELVDQKDYYVNGSIYTKYEYKKGDLESMLIHDYDGVHTTTYKFKNDYLKQMLRYDKSGNEIEKESIGKNDDFTGKWFYTNNKSMQGNFKKGKRHGRWVFYNLNGTKDSEANYELGVKNGLQKEYDNQGKLTIQYEMKDGKNDGYYRRFYESGELKSEGWYIDGDKYGDWYEYYIDGTTQSEAYYLNDELVGKYLDYDPDGKLIAIYNYKGGEFISYENIDRSGKTINKVVISELKTDMLPCSKLTFAGYKKEKINGLNEGPTYSEPIQGIFDYIGNYASGEEQGLFTHYYGNGNKLASANFLMGEREGLDTNFYHTGSIYTIDNNILNNNYGQYVRYYYNGNVWMTRKFINDSRDSIETIYGINGEIILQKHFKLGFFNFIVRNNEAGELTDTVKAINETLSYEAKYKNGQVAIKEDIKLENLIEFKMYDDKGQLLYNYEGDENGYDIKREFFYLNGKTMSLASYDKGQLTEKKYYREDGTLDCKEEFKFGQTHGKTIAKDEQGNTKVNLIYRKNVAYEMGE